LQELLNLGNPRIDFLRRMHTARCMDVAVITECAHPIQTQGHASWPTQSFYLTVEIHDGLVIERDAGISVTRWTSKWQGSTGTTKK
jgi:hypothetical protein